MRLSRRAVADVAVVFAGGLVGSAARSLVAEAASSATAVLLIVNLTGSFLLGVLVAWRLRVGRGARVIVNFAAIGVLGSFTTFSGFAVAVVTLPAATAFLLAVVSLAGGLVLVRLGLLVGGRA